MLSKELIKEDLQRLTKKAMVTRYTVFEWFILNRGFRLTYLYRKRHSHKVNHHRIRYAFYKGLNAMINTVYFDDTADIGAGLLFVHSYGCSIGRINAGKNLTIHNNVTLGWSYKFDAEGRTAPIIGDNVVFAVGAVVLGPIKLGSNIMVGANAVVTKDFPSNCIIGGVPAKIIKKEFDEKRFLVD
jgi:serine O-acetyltransferase